MSLAVLSSLLHVAEAGSGVLILNDRLSIMSIVLCIMCTDEYTNGIVFSVHVYKSL